MTLSNTEINRAETDLAPKSSEASFACQACASTSFSEIPYYHDKNRVFGTDQKYSSTLRSFGVKVHSLINRDVQLLYQKTVPKFMNGFIKICENCGLGQWINELNEEDLSLFYSKLYRGPLPLSMRRTSWLKHGIKTIIQSAGLGGIYDNLSERRNPGRSPTGNKRAREQFDFIQSHSSVFSNTNAVLEIGGSRCWFGQHCRHRLNQKIEIYSIEPDETVERYYKLRNIHKIGNMFPVQTQLTFDLVVASHWLEHVLDLGKTLIDLKSVVRADSHLFIEVPDHNEGANYDSILVPHIYFFTSEALRQLFEGAGFETVQIESNGRNIKCLFKFLGATNE